MTTVLKEPMNDASAANCELDEFEDVDGGRWTRYSQASQNSPCVMDTKSKAALSSRG